MAVVVARATVEVNRAVTKEVAAAVVLPRAVTKEAVAAMVLPRAVTRRSSMFISSIHHPWERSDGC